VSPQSVAIYNTDNKWFFRQKNSTYRSRCYWWMHV